MESESQIYYTTDGKLIFDATGRVYEYKPDKFSAYYRHDPHSPFLDIPIKKTIWGIVDKLNFDWSLGRTSAEMKDLILRNG